MKHATAQRGGMRVAIHGRQSFIRFKTLLIGLTLWWVTKKLIFAIYYNMNQS